MAALLFMSVVQGGRSDCSKIPEGITSPSSVQDPVHFEIEISGHPDAYVAGEQYTGEFHLMENPSYC